MVTLGLAQWKGLKGTAHRFENSSKTSLAVSWVGMHLKSTADFSLRAAAMNTKYLLVSGVKGSL
jgi:hypothetical protein